MREFLNNLALQSPIAFSLLVILIATVGIKLVYAGVKRYELSELTARLIVEAFFCAYVAALLTALGWWRAVGFMQPLTGKTLWAYAPLLSLPLLLVVTGGIRTAGARQMLGFTVFLLMVGFAEEGLLRGVVLHALLPGGRLSAAFLSAFLFGLSHLLSVLQGHDLKSVLAQVVYATFLGIGFAGPFLHTGAIWPAIIVHMLIDLADFAGRGFEMPQPKPFVFKQALIPILITALYALYGWWMLSLPPLTA